MKHEPGPWQLTGEKNCTIVKDTCIVAQPQVFCDVNAANMARIVACVNALEGIEHPQELVDFLRGIKTGPQLDEALVKVYDENVNLKSQVEALTENNAGLLGSNAALERIRAKLSNEVLWRQQTIDKLCALINEILSQSISSSDEQRYVRKRTNEILGAVQGEEKP